uniref:Uncharacterized protein n=1 Tax=Globodera rostochiensis TaxID=31243 RepID=A0A914HV73_GLORO
MRSASGMETEGIENVKNGQKCAEMKPTDGWGKQLGNGGVSLPTAAAVYKIEEEKFSEGRRLSASFNDRSNSNGHQKQQQSVHFAPEDPQQRTPRAAAFPTESNHSKATAIASGRPNHRPNDSRLFPSTFSGTGLCGAVPS